MGALSGITVVEIAAIGPVPFCGMLFADLGADVIRVDRVASGSASLPLDLVAGVGRGRRSIAVDLKTSEGRDIVLRIADGADALIEGFRPGVAERLGIGPEVVLDRNQRLVYGRMTGWGSEGPYALSAGHDINYIGLVGALAAIGAPDGPPQPALNLIGDYGGGALYLAVGVLAGLIEAARSGVGQVVEAAMVDGAASLMSLFYQMHGAGLWDARRGANLLDGGAPFYTTYRTADDRWVAVGALEPQFYASLLVGLGIDAAGLPHQLDRDGWPELRRRFSEVFATRTRDEWEVVFSGTDACVTPVLTLEEAAAHPQIRERGTLVDAGGHPEPAPAPRFSATPSQFAGEIPARGADSDAILRRAGFSGAEIEELRRRGVVT